MGQARSQIASGSGSMCSAHRALSPGQAVTIPFASIHLAVPSVPDRAVHQNQFYPMRGALRSALRCIRSH